MVCHQLLALSAPTRRHGSLLRHCLALICFVVRPCRAAWGGELYLNGWATPESCVHGECLPWDNLPSEILDSEGLDSSGDLFASGRAPNSRQCARPDRLRRERPWCYCVGPRKGWAYCDQELLNCSHVPCFHSENTCGEYSLPCRDVARPNGGMVVTVDFIFRPDGTFRRTERGAFDRASCANGEPWLQMVYEGSWAYQGPSLVKNGSSLALMNISTVWLKLLREEACIPASGSRTEPICVNTTMVLKDLCPCNDWDWSRKGMPVDRHIGMFCQPKETCPLLHEVMLHKTHYFTYNATPVDMCLFKANTDQEKAWERPVFDACAPKAVPFNCIAGLLDSARQSVGLSLVVILVLVVQTVACL